MLTFQGKQLNIGLDVGPRRMKAAAKTHSTEKPSEDQGVHQASEYAERAVTASGTWIGAGTVAAWPPWVKDRSSLPHGHELTIVMDACDRDPPAHPSSTCT